MEKSGRWKLAALLAGAMPLFAGSAKTFSGDVRPILEKRCAGCHQSGEIGPMPLTSYQQARPWASAIREAVLSRKMPPWDAAPGAGHAFRNDRSLSQQEIETIAAWADGGAVEGKPAAPLTAPARED